MLLQSNCAMLDSEIGLWAVSYKATLTENIAEQKCLLSEIEQDASHKLYAWHGSFGW